MSLRLSQIRDTPLKVCWQAVACNDVCILVEASQISQASHLSSSFSKALEHSAVNAFSVVDSQAFNLCSVFLHI